jgi:hypothetical protein
MSVPPIFQFEVPQITFPLTNNIDIGNIKISDSIELKISISKNQIRDSFKTCIHFSLLNPVNLTIQLVVSSAINSVYKDQTQFTYNFNQSITEIYQIFPFTPSKFFKQEINFQY